MKYVISDCTDVENDFIDREKRRTKVVSQRPESQPLYKGEGQGSNERRRMRKSLRRNAPFIAWDGEGTSKPGEAQPYCLFGASTKDRLKGPQLSTKSMLQLILRVGRDNPGAIHVSYAFVYDVNQILWEFNTIMWRRLFEREVLSGGKVRKKGECYWKGYMIKWIPGKIFEVSGVEEDSGKYVTVTIYDIFSFFGCKFTEALKVWVPGYDGNEIIETGKANRNRFTWRDIKAIETYWTEEIEQLVVLAEALRKNLREGAELELNKWYGPGAIAEGLFRKHGIDECMDREIPEPVNTAAQHAYFAGRFELWSAGLYDGPIWQNDINSAYPAAMVHLPNLAEGWWEWVEEVEEVEHFGVYHIRTADGTMTREEIHARTKKCQKPEPLPYRTTAGAVRFPEWVEGWYWSPEARLVHGKGTHEFLGGWVFREADVSSRPFAWVAELYQKRLDFKSARNPAELSVKLGLNSLYGKMAQRIGWNEITGEPPKWHQLEWAGWITSYTRAALYPLLMEAWERDALVSCETDSVMATVELGIVWDQKKLGAWDYKQYQGVVYLQSGLYFKGESGRWSYKIRGMDKPPGEGVELEPDQVPLTFERVMEWMRSERPFQETCDCGEEEQQGLHVTTTRFVGIHKALHQKRPWLHRVWMTDSKHVKLGGNGKRLHISGKCRRCKRGERNGMGMHDLCLTTMVVGVMSTRHKLPWLEKVDEYEFVEEKIREGAYGGEMVMG